MTTNASNPWLARRQRISGFYDYKIIELEDIYKDYSRTCPGLGLGEIDYALLLDLRID